MITLKLIIYSFILFILLVKFSSCENNIIDLINIILIITLFNLILEKFMNTNIKENYDPISNNNYSILDTNIIDNNYSNVEIKELEIKKKKKNLKRKNLKMKNLKRKNLKKLKIILKK